MSTRYAAAFRTYKQLGYDTKEADKLAHQFAQQSNGGKHRSRREPGHLSSALTLGLGMASIVLFLAFFIGVLFGIVALMTGIYSLLILKRDDVTHRMYTIIGMALASSSITLLMVVVVVFGAFGG